MANKVVYNNTSYDIVDAITLANRDYLILVDRNNLNNITFLESMVIDGEQKYFLPPKNFKIANNPNCDLKRLQVNFVVTNIVEILKSGINNGTLNNYDHIRGKFKEICEFIQTDSNIYPILFNDKKTNTDEFLENSKKLENYLNKEFSYNISSEIEDYSNYMDRPIRTSNGLDYEWLYNLNLVQLKELTGSKNRTSEELIYILDALDKRKRNDEGINHYNEMGKSLQLTKKENKAAFIDVLLIVLITASFALLLFLEIF